MVKKIKYYDRSAGNMLLASLVDRIDLFDSPEMETITHKDFEDRISKIVYSALNNMYRVGHTKVTEQIIQSTLKGQPKSLAYYQEKGGPEYVENLLNVADFHLFHPSLDKVKKMSLLRNLDSFGMNLSKYYDWDTENEKIRSEQDTWLNMYSLDQITEQISSDFDAVITETGMRQDIKESHIGDGLDELIASLKENPEFGSPMSIGMTNSIVRGARKGKFYLRSAPTGGGKSRLMMADTVHFGANALYSHHQNRWIENGIQEPALFISTELEIDECQTMAVAYLTGIDEEKILDGRYTKEEEQIIKEGTKIFKESPIYIVYMPDFSINTVERMIKKHYREHKVEYVNFDYIHSSMSFIAEISAATNGMKLREDQILFMLSTKLKELANNLHVFIQSGTQVNGDWEEKEEVNQNLLRGSKAIADRVDVGAIGMKIRDIDLPIVEKIETLNPGKTPNYFISFYKIRRGKYAGARIWCNLDLGTCRAEGIMVTNQYGDPMEFTSYMINVRKEEKKKQEELHGKNNALE